MNWAYILTSFDGRLNRARFWIGVAVIVVAMVAAGLADSLLGLQLGQSGVGMLAAGMSLVSAFFALAVWSKRWHDRDKSGWWTLIAIVPIVGQVWFLVELCVLRGTTGPNRFGPDPLAR